MEKPLSKKTLIAIATAIKNDEKVEIELIDPFLSHKFEELTKTSRFMLKVAAGLSLFFASVLVIFPEVGEWLIKVLPGFFLLPERLSKALDYVWGLVGEPVEQQHLMYHLPNIIVYAFGVAGIRQLWKKLNKNNWKDLVARSQEKLAKTIEDGTARFRFAPGLSLLFIGDGDQLGKSLVADAPTVGREAIIAAAMVYVPITTTIPARAGAAGHPPIMIMASAISSTAPATKSCLGSATRKPSGAGAMTR